jgi:hypothetical protein
MSALDGGAGAGADFGSAFDDAFGNFAVPNARRTKADEQHCQHKGLAAASRRVAVASSGPGTVS